MKTTTSQAEKAAPTETNVEIYTLSHPETGEVRYVGKANNAAKRLKDHLREVRSTTPLYCWIAKLRRAGLVPKMDVACVTVAGEWQSVERAMIEQGRADGLRLLNVADGGDEPSCPRSVRAANAARNAVARTSTPEKKRIYELKRDMGQMLKKGLLSDETRATLRLCAQKRPDLFGIFANA